MSDKPKVETLQEFLARGGEIEVVPEHIDDEQEPEITCKSTSTTPLTPMHLTEGALFFAKKIKKKHKKKLTKDMEALPKDLIAFLKKKGKI